jgi:type VI secretion system protein ImpE
MEPSLQSTSEDLFRAGLLREAIEAQSAAVKATPSDIRRRWVLAELLCFVGEWERADRALEVIVAQAPQQQAAVLAFQHLLRGEEVRRQVMNEGRAPEILGAERNGPRAALTALLCLREGKPEDAVHVLAEDESPVAVGGTRNREQSFDGFRDLDDVYSPFVEMIAHGGRYLWVSVAALKLIEIEPLTTVRDLLWRPARLSVQGGPVGNVFLPTIYPTDPAGTATGADRDALRLGRRTEWLDRPGAPVRGLGLRSFLVGETDIPIHELGRLEFREPAIGVRVL